MLESYLLLNSHSLILPVGNVLAWHYCALPRGNILGPEIVTNLRQQGHEPTGHQAALVLLMEQHGFMPKLA